MKIKAFDKAGLNIKPLADRKHDLDISAVSELERSAFAEADDALRVVAKNIVGSSGQRKAVILMMGAHVIRSGVQRYIIDLMQRGYLSCIAINGGGMIHDFEFALIGATTESAARHGQQGQFGLRKETPYACSKIRG